VATVTVSRETVLAILDGVKDPEVPVLSVVELGIVREVELTDGEVTVVLTPTYSGCPAMHVIEEDIRAALAASGMSRVQLRTVYAPAWTTEWMSDAAREKLRAYGIAPPGHVAGQDFVALTRAREPVPCPYCGSKNTVLRSEFSSTACKAMHTCRACSQPFEEFKAI
jgi:ring-1,2-phenylacetyl-CoA epoxidase subunit PaaD